MKTRQVTLFSGERFEVPRGIQRIDTRSTHGWQVRYQGTKMFSDHTRDGSGARDSLERATRELLRRIATLPAPVTLQRGPSQTKSSQLPPGISGPIVRSRAGTSVRSASLSVLLPQYGKKARVTSVYIGNENTYTRQRFREALAKAIELRETAVARYAVEATKARRAEARALKNGSAAARKKPARKS